MVLVDLVAFYALVGAAIALAFVTIGIARVLPAGTSVTIGARVLLLPGAAILWPYVVWRWIRAAR